MCFTCHSATRHEQAHKPCMCACAATAVFAVARQGSQVLPPFLRLFVPTRYASRRTMATPSMMSQDVDDAHLDSAVGTGIIMDVVSSLLVTVRLCLFQASVRPTWSTSISYQGSSMRKRIKGTFLHAVRSSLSLLRNMQTSRALWIRTLNG